MASHMLRADGRKLLAVVSGNGASKEGVVALWLSRLFVTSILDHDHLSRFLTNFGRKGSQSSLVLVVSQRSIPFGHKIATHDNWRA